jgi:D-lactate dehydrogenase
MPDEASDEKVSAPEKLREEVAKAADSPASPAVIAVFSAREYEVAAFEGALAAEKEEAADKALPYTMRYIEAELNPETVRMADGCAAVCVFVNDAVSKDVLDWLGRYTSCRLVLLRCAGFNNVDLATAAVNKISVARVPAYSPYAVAEHAVALCMTLNRKIHKAYLRNRDGNFSLRGLTGFDMHGRTVGIVGTGKIGEIAANIFLGFGCTVVAHSRSQNAALTAKGVEYMTLDDLCAKCDIISLHAPMTKETHHCINEARIALMKPGVMIINTSRGGLLDTKAAIAGLKSRQIGALGLDVYEEEAGLFFKDHTGEVRETARD